jgi:hypothetical protein
MQAVRARWGGTRDGESHFDTLARIKQAVKDQTKHYFRTTSEAEKLRAENLPVLARALRLFHAASKHTPCTRRIQALGDLDPELGAMIRRLPSGSYDTSALDQHIDSLFGAATADALQGYEGEHPELPASFLPPTSSTNSIKDIKAQLPSGRELRLTHLRNAEGIPTNDPEGMGNIVHNYYEDIWAKCPAECREEELDPYLSHFTPRIPPELLPKLPSQDDLHDLINDSTDSAAGPDGIPFAF